MRNGSNGWFRASARAATVLGFLVAAFAPTTTASEIVGSARLIRERRGHTATALGNGKILVAGGQNLSGALPDVEIFDGATGTFTAAARLLTPRAEHTATRLADGRVLLIGGRGAEALASTEFYDSTRNVFSSGPSLNSPRSGHTTTLLFDGRIVVIGGNAEGTAEVFDPRAGTFTALPCHLSEPRSFHAAARLLDGSILIAGGLGDDGVALRSAEILRPDTLECEPIGTMFAARSRFVLRPLPDGKVQAIGGDADSTMELFNPAGYFSSLVHLAGTVGSESAALRSAGRVAIIGPSARTALDGPAPVAGEREAPRLVQNLLDRIDYSMTELPEAGMAIVAGGVSSSGQYQPMAVLFSSSSTTVTTDQTDYAPGETVVMTGTGWLPGETVTLNIHRDTNDPPDTVLSAVADANGNFTNSDYVVQDYDLGVTFLLTATGQTSGYTAQTSFTDGNVRVRTNAAGITFDLDWTTYAGTTCAGTEVDSDTEPDVGFSGGDRFTKGVGNTESISLTAEAFSNQGGNFINWTSGPPIQPSTPTNPTTSLTICVPGFNGSGTREYVANYVAGNSAPIVTTGDASVTVDEGQTAGNTGTYADNTTVTFTASVGTVTQTGTSSGTWTWSFGTNDGPAQSQAVTITATDTLGASTVTTFPLSVNNVAPTATLSNNGPINEGGSATVSFTAPSDPSSVDTSAGFHYAYSCTNGDLSGSTYAGSGTASSTSCSFDDNGSFPVKGKIIDKDGGFTEYTTSVVVNNVAPTASFTGPLAVDEGSPATYSFSAQSDPSSADTTAGFHYAYDCNGGSLAGATYAGSGTSASTSCTFPDGPASATVRARIIDKDGGFTEYTLFPVVVANVPPSVTAAANQSADEGASTSFALGSFTDPGADSPWGVDVDWGDLSPHTTFNVTSAGSLGSQNHTYADNGTYTVTVRVTDKDSAVDSKTFTVTVANVAPTATLANNGPINEGGSATITFSGQSDPSSTDTAAGFHYAYSCTSGDLSGATYASTLGSTASTTCSFDDNGSYTVKGRIIDKDDGFTEYTTTVVVNNVAPTAVLGNNGPVNEGSPAAISFSGQSDPSSADTTAGFHYAFSCSGASLAGATYAGSGASASTACTFADNGTYLVTGRIIDKDNGSTEYSTSVVVNNVAPTVTAPADQTAGEGTLTSFSLGSFGDPGTADNPWAVDVDWGDGSPHTTFSVSAQGTLAAQDHAYADNNTYTVTVTVTDKDGAASNPAATFQVTVTNAPPTATLSNNGPVDEASPVTITFSDQADSSAADTAAGFHHAYSCTNGDLSAATYATSGTNVSTTCTFDDNGTYTVKARIIDKDDGFTEYTTVVTVNNVAPTGTLSNNGPVNEGSPATISFSGQLDPSSADTAAGFHYAYDCNGGSLSGATYAGSGANASTTCTFADNGSYTVSGRIIDKDGGFTDYTTTVTVNNVAPSVTAPANQSSDEGSSNSFSLGSFSDPGTADNPWTVSVNWGDSTPVETFPVNSQGAVGLSHTYDDNGTYTVTYTVTDKDGGVSAPASTFQVTVANVAPTATFNAPASADEGSAISLSLTSPSDPSNADTAAGFTYAFDCGDGAGYGAFSATSTASCPTPDSGSRTVRGKIRDKDGGESEYTASVTVNNVAPTAVLSNNGPVDEGSPAAVSFSAQFDPSSVDTAAGFHFAYSCSGGSLAGATYAGSGINASTMCTYPDNGTYLVTARIIDKDDGFTEYSTSVVVNNVAPTLTSPGDQTGNEGVDASFSLGSFSDPGTADAPWTVEVSWGDTNSDTFTTSSQGATAHNHTYADSGTYTVTVKVKDKDNAYSNEVTFQVTVVNTPPTATLSNDGPVNEASPATITFTDQFDPSATDTAAGFHYAYSCTNGDLSAATYASGVTNDSTTCTFDDNGTYTVKARIIDKDDGFTEYTTVVTVSNVAPTGTLSNNGPVNEGSPATINFSGQFDPSIADTTAGFHYAYACDNGDLSGATYGLSGSNTSTTCTFVDNGTYPVRARIIDKDDGYTEYTTVVTVNNVSPSVTAPANQNANEGSSTSFSLGSFSDPGTADAPWTVAVNWGDSNSDSFTTGSQGSISHNHTYDDNGAYTVHVTVTDKDSGLSNEITFQVIVSNVEPTATLSNDGPVDEGSPATISFSGQFDPSTADTAAGFRYAYSCTNGDLSAATYASSGMSASQTCTFNDNGTYPVKARIIDKDDGFTEYTTNVVVNNVAPTGTFSGPASVDEGSPAAYSFSAQFDPSSADGAAGFHYAYACDGSSLAGATYAGSSTSASVSCTFPDGPASVAVRSRIIDKDDGFTEYTFSVTVNNVVPSLAAPSNQNASEGSSTLFALGSFSDPGTADSPWTVSVNWGDGPAETFPASSQGAISRNHTYDDNGIYNVSVTVTDKDGAPSNTATFQVTVANVAPTATFNAPSSVDEGSAISLSLTAASDPSNADTTTGFQYAFDCGDGVGYGPYSSTSTASCPTTDDESRTVKGKIKDKDGGETEYTATVTVSNVAPTATLSNNGPVNEGSPATVTFSGQSDPSSADTAAGFHYAFACDGSSLAGATYAGSGTSAATTCTFNDNGAYPVRGRIIDKDGGYTEYMTAVAVNNVAPTSVVLSLTASSINESGSVDLSGSFADPGSGDTHMLTISWGDGTLNTVINLGPGVTSFGPVPHTYMDDNPSGTSSDAYPIVVTVTDDDGGAAGGSTSITVNNVAPTISNVTGPSAPLTIGSSVTITATFSDVGTLDTHACMINWDDGATTPGVVTETNGSGSCTGTHTYSTAGVGTVQVTVTDDDTGSVLAIYEFVVIYDPNGGFVTGGGWINSAPGSYPADPDATGKANFGFVSKYKKGSNVPDGETEFQFKAGDLNFHSSAYDGGSLVISGYKATYRGTGTINGAGSYRFLVIAYDGNRPGGGGVDRFRIKISTLSGGVVYDNRMGLPEDMDTADPTAIGGGSIVIHK